MANSPDPLHALNTLTPWSELENNPHPGRKPILVSFLETEEGQDRFEKILTYIKAGAFEHVAAQAMGIDRSVWQRWKVEGRRYLLSGIEESPWAAWYKEFYLRVSAAVNECRMLAEVDVRQSDPKFWLTRGPGRGDRIDDPGWVESTAIEIHQENEPARTENHLHIHTESQQTERELIDKEDQELNNLAAVLEQLETLGITSMTETAKGVIDASPSPSSSPQNVTETDEESDIAKKHELNGHSQNGAGVPTVVNPSIDDPDLL